MLDIPSSSESVQVDVMKTIKLPTFSYIPELMTYLWESRDKNWNIMQVWEIKFKLTIGRNAMLKSVTVYSNNCADQKKQIYFLLRQIIAIQKSDEAMRTETNDKA